MPEPLPETGVLANHSSDFGLVKRTASQPAGRTDRSVYLDELKIGQNIYKCP